VAISLDRQVWFTFCSFIVSWANATEKQGDFMTGIWVLLDYQVHLPHHYVHLIMVLGLLGPPILGFGGQMKTFEELEQIQTSQYICFWK
jgi:hypothetical protein